MTILKMVIISIKYIIRIISVEHNIVFQAGWNLSVPEYFTSSTSSLRHPHWEYPGETASSSCRWHRNHSTPPAQSFWRSARRPQGGFRGRMQDVVCKLVGFWLVPRYVMNANGTEWVWEHIATRSAYYYINYCYYNTYFSLIEIIRNKWYNINNWFNRHQNI